MGIVRAWLLPGRNSRKRNSLAWRGSRSPSWTALRNGTSAASTRWVHMDGNSWGQRWGRIPSGAVIRYCGLNQDNSSSRQRVFCVLWGFFFPFEKQKSCSLKGKAVFCECTQFRGVFRPCHLGERRAVPETLSWRAGRHLRGHSHWLNGQLACSLRRTHRHKAALSAESI